MLYIGLTDARSLDYRLSQVFAFKNLGFPRFRRARTTPQPHHARVIGTIVIWIGFARECVANFVRNCVLTLGRRRNVSAFAADIIVRQRECL